MWIKNLHRHHTSNSDNNVEVSLPLFKRLLLAGNVKSCDNGIPHFENYRRQGSYGTPTLPSPTPKKCFLTEQKCKDVSNNLPVSYYQWGNVQDLKYVQKLPNMCYVASSQVRPYLRLVKPSFTGSWLPGENWKAWKAIGSVG